MTLSKDQILKADDLPFEDVEVPEWGGTVRIRSMTGFERDRWEAQSITQRGKDQKLNLENIRARLVAFCLVDEQGDRLFTDAEAKELGKKSARVLDRLFDAARKLSGLTEEDVEELAEGFADDPSEVSTSA